MRSAAAIAICAAAADASRRQSETRSRALPRSRRTIARVVDSGRAGVALWIALVVPSSFVVHKYGGSAGAIAYALVAAAAVARAPELPARVSDRTVFRFALITLVLVAAVFAVVYPIVDARAPGAGSDDDNTLDLGASALLAGRFPYAQTTYLGNHLHHLAGAFVLAAPFAALGASALQNVFWIPMFFVAVWVETRDSRRALELAWLVLALSPAVIHDIVTGTGYASNAIAVVLGLWWLTRTRHRDLAAAAWGVALASRANFLLLVPIACGWLREHVGPHAALRAAAIVSATVALLTLPFYLHDPQAFTPLEAADRLLRFGALAPHLGGALIASTAALAVALSFGAMDAAALFRRCAWVQAFPAAVGLALSCVQEQRLTLWYARYAAWFAWFALMALAAGGSLKRHETARRELVDEREQIGL